MMTNDDPVQFGNDVTALLERYNIRDGKYWTQRLIEGTLRFRVEGTLPLTTMTDDSDIRRAERRVAQAAIDYVNYLFPPEETGEGRDVSGGLIRAVRALEQAGTAERDTGRTGDPVGMYIAWPNNNSDDPTQL